MDVIYLDNAATSFPKPPCVGRAMAGALAACGANPGRAGHKLALAAGRIVESCREDIAAMLGETDASRVVFAQNATDALNMAIHGALRTGDHAIATLLEHNSVLRPLTELSRSGAITLTLIPPDGMGRIHAADVERAMTRRTHLVVMTHMSNVLGLVQDVAAVGEICRQRGVLFLVDCAQTCNARQIERAALQRIRHHFRLEHTLGCRTRSALTKRRKLHPLLHPERACAMRTEQSLVSRHGQHGRPPWNGRQRQMSCRLRAVHQK